MKRNENPPKNYCKKDIIQICNKKNKGGMFATATITKVALIAAVYAALTLAIPMLGFGVVQFRISEALTIFSVISPVVVSGLSLGCFIANILGVVLGFNPMPLDILFGTLATLLAAVATYCLRNIKFKTMPILAWLPPVLINALIIGFEYSFIYISPDAQMGFLYFLYNAFTIFLGEFIVCAIIGMPLYYIINKRINLQKYF